MRFEVLLTEDAERDLEDIYTYIAHYDSPRNADHVLDRLLQVAESLTTSPDRGQQPRELSALGIREYRQIFFKSYRVIYRQVAHRILIYLIADDRRDMQSLLARRLLTR
ncbi:MAG: type II toxin-antitoxin system RelE/ParE family toxin [Proteobacteria bacterium]|nr:type II toxin-antitoxin system RelE/ParE family toxin [Pseudomonadota bacterium]